MGNKKDFKRSSVIRDFFRLFSPHICPLCHSAMQNSEQIICFGCMHDLPQTDFHTRPADNPLAQTFWGRVPLEFAVARYYYSKGLKTQRLIHLLKYKNRPEIGIETGKTYGKILFESGILNHVDAIIPVPLHQRKLRIRGYNQSEVFAIGLSETTGIPIDKTSLQRVAFTETQTKKSRFKRWENVKEMFSLVHPEQIKNKHIAIVDDVVTTGATLESCITELLKGENTKVSVISIATATSS